jgi:hypothetical protein
MNYKKLAAIIRSEKCKAVYEIINGWLYLMTPRVGFIICNTYELPKVLNGLVKKEDTIGATKERLLRLSKKDWLPAVDTGLSYRLRSVKCAILQGTSKSGEAYPIFIDEDLLSLGPKNPELILSAGEGNIVMAMGDNNTFFYQPRITGTSTLCDILGVAQTVCMKLNPEQGGVSTAYVKLEDVQKIHNELACAGPPCDFSSEDTWDRAFFSAGEKLKELPRKMI